MHKSIQSYLWMIILMCGCNHAEPTKVSPTPQANPTAQVVSEEPLNPKPIPDDYPIAKQWQAAFLKADKIELFSLKENDYEDHELPKLHGCYILGSAFIQGTADKQQLLDELPSFIPEVEPTLVAPCAPNFRHAIRLHVGEKQHDILICFQCSQAELFSPTLPIPIYHDGIGGDAEVLNQMLTKYKVPLNR